MDKTLKAIIEQPELEIYIADFGKADDWCFIAETREKMPLIFIGKEGLRLLMKTKKNI